MESIERGMIGPAVKWRFFICLLVAAGGMGVSRGADDSRPASPLRSELQAFTVETRQGVDEEFTQAELVEPGEVIEYRLLYKNISASPLIDIVAAGKIAGNSDYIPDSASATILLIPHFSIDHGRTFQAEPIVEQVELADGTMVEQEAGPESYTHVRWHIPELKPEQTTELHYRVRVR